MTNGKFTQLATEAAQRKEYALQTGHNGMIPHDLWRRLVPIAMQYDRGNADMALLYSYLIANVNGQVGNDRYMSAFTSVERIAEQTRIGRNRVAKLSDALEACGLLRTTYDYAGNKREKLYYPLYYSVLSDEDIHANMAEWRAKYGR